MGNASYFKGNTIIFDYFSAPTLEEIESEVEPAYRTETARAWFENGLDMLGLKKDDFEFYAKYVKDSEEGITQDGQKVFP